jgi:hypothetical protein
MRTSVEVILVIARNPIAYPEKRSTSSLIERTLSSATDIMRTSQDTLLLWWYNA